MVHVVKREECIIWMKVLLLQVLLLALLTPFYRGNIFIILPFLVFVRYAHHIHHLPIRVSCRLGKYNHRLGKYDHASCPNQVKNQSIVPFSTFRCVGPLSYSLLERTSVRYYFCGRFLPYNMVVSFEREI